MEMRGIHVYGNSNMDEDIVSTSVVVTEGFMIRLE